MDPDVTQYGLWPVAMLQILFAMYWRFARKEERGPLRTFADPTQSGGEGLKMTR
jgi:hypothetical protein